MKNQSGLQLGVTLPSPGGSIWKCGGGGIFIVTMMGVGATGIW